MNQSFFTKHIISRSRWMFFLLLGMAQVNAQTTLVNPDLEGGFAEGATFSSNGWTVVNGAATNQWFLGTVATGFQGSAAYISADAGVTNGYTNTASGYVHFYRDVTFPAGETNINLSFRWKGVGEGNYDGIQVSLGDVATIPTAAATSSGVIAGPYVTGATVVGNVVYNGNTNVQVANINIAPGVTGNCTSSSTKRLIFTWRSDGSGGTAPSGAIDSISLTSQIAATPITSAGGVFTINNTAPTSGTNFANFTAAINALNLGLGCGITGAVTFNVSAGQTFVEMPPAISITGSATAGIVFQKAGSGVNPVIAPVATAGTSDYGICISGSDYVTFDGIDINGATVGGQVVEYGYLIRNASAINGAQYNTIKNCTIQLDRTSTATRAIFQTTSTTGGGAVPTANSGTNSDNKFLNFKISNSFMGVYLLGNTTYRDSNCEIGTTNPTTFNEIGSVAPNDLGVTSSFSTLSGIYTSGQTNVSIHHNIVRNITNGSSSYGIFSGLNSGQAQVYSNKIYNINTISTSAVVAGCYVEFSTTAGPVQSALIYNNFVSGLSGSPIATSTAPLLHGIYAVSGNATTTYNIHHNNVWIDAVGTTTNSVALRLGGSTAIYIAENNNLINTSTNPTAGKHFGIVTSATATLGAAGSRINYNNLYLPNALNGFVGSSGAIGTAANNRATLANWRAAFSTDANSVQVDPGYNNATDLHTTAAGIDGVATAPPAWVTTDMDNETRTTPHDIGADQFTISAVDMGIVGLITPSAVACNIATQSVTVSVKNTGTTAIDFAMVPATVTVSVTGATTATLTATVNSGTLAVGATQTVTLSGNLNMSNGGTYTLAMSVAIAGDGNTSNNSLTANSVVAPTMSVPLVQDFNAATTIPAGWSSTGSLSYATSHANGATGNGAYSNLYSFNANVSLTSPKVGAIVATNVFSFDYRLMAFSGYPGAAVSNATSWGTLKVQISTDCGATFTDALTINNTNHLEGTAWATKTVPLSAYAGQTLIFRVLGTWAAGDYYLDLDNINVGTPPAADMSAISLVNPVTGICGSATQSVTARIKNSGAATMNFANNPTVVTVNVTGATTATLTTTLNTGTWAPDSTQNVVLPGTFDMSRIGDYNFAVFVSTGTDANRVNDTLRTVRTIDTIMGIPYLQDFNASINLPTAWSVSSNASVSATHGNGGNGLNVNLDNVGETATFTSPKLGIITSNDILAFQYRLVNYTSYPTTATPNTSNWGYFNVQVSTNCGATYTTIMRIDSTNHTASLAWATQEIPLSSYSGQTVRVRIAATYNTGDYYLDFDNFSITSPCIGAPTAGTNVSDVTSICRGNSVVLSNTGASAGNGINYQWQNSADGTNWFNVMGANSPNYTATNLIAATQYRLAVQCVHSATTSYSDAVSIMVSQPATANIPYSQNFDTWATRCAAGTSTNDSPAPEWNNNPTSGNTSWRRNNQGTTAAWSSPTAGSPANRTATDTTFARFHSYFAPSRTRGALNLHLNLSGAGEKILAFDYINTDGTDSLFISKSDDGVRFSPVGTLATRSAWTRYQYVVNSTSATAVFRFEAVSDYGNSDIGVDNLKVFAVPVAGTTVSSAPTVCRDSMAMLSVTGASMDTTMTRQWQSSFDNSAWVDIGGATTATYNARVSANSYYRCKVISMDSTATSTSQRIQLGNSIPSVIPSGATTFCVGDSVRLTARGGVSYSWSNGSMDSTTIVRTSGGYRVLATNALGCKDSSAIINVIASVPTVAITGSTAICTGDSTIFTASGGSTYSWSNGATTAGIIVRNAGTYKVTVTNATGCVDSTTRTLVVNARPTALLIVSGVATFCQGDSAILRSRGGATYRWTTPTGTSTDSIVTAKITGAYKVLAFNALGCSDSANITITVNPKPTVSFTSTSLGANATFTNTSTSGSTYSWNFGDATALGTTMNATHAYTANGTYQVKLVVTSAAGCRDSITNTIVITRVANEEILAGLKALVYPNPTTRNLYIEFQTTTIQFGSNDFISVTDAFGREIYRQAIGGNFVELNTENWAAGLYMIHAVISNQKMGLSKIVKIDK